MSIQVVTKLMAGVKFSHICTVPENPDLDVSCATDELLDLITNSFEDNIINTPEVTPQLVSFLLDLDYFPTPDGDAYIGEEISSVDIGTQSIDVRQIREVEKICRQVSEKLNTAKIIDSSPEGVVKIAMIGSIKTDEIQDDEEEDED